MQLTRTARGPVRHCRRQDDRKYCPGDMSSAIHVRRHRCAIVQGRPIIQFTTPTATLRPTHNNTRSFLFLFCSEPLL